MSCSTPRQYVITLPANGAVTPLFYRRTGGGVADPDGTEGSAGKNFLQVLFPQTKQAGTSNPSGGTVVLLWSDTDLTANVTLANTPQLVEIGFGGFFTTPLADFRSGWFYAVMIGGVAGEIHCTETTR